MPAVSLNQRSGALLELGVSAAVFLGSVGFLFCLLASAAVQSSGFHNVCCPNASFFGARFKLLSVGVFRFPITCTKAHTRSDTLGATTVPSGSTIAKNNCLKHTNQK